MRRLPLFLTESQMITDFTNDADMFSMSCPRFQWIDVILFKWNWKAKTQKSRECHQAFIPLIWRFRQNTYQKLYTPLKTENYIKHIGYILFINPQTLPTPTITCYNTITTKNETTTTKISCPEYKYAKASKIKQRTMKQRTMKNRKTKSYQNKKFNNFTKQLQTYTQTGISVHTKTYQKTKNTQFWHGSHVGANNANSDSLATSLFGIIRMSERVIQTPTSSQQTDDNQAKQKIQYLNFFKGQKPIKNNP